MTQTEYGEAPPVKLSKAAKPECTTCCFRQQSHHLQATVCIPDDLQMELAPVHAGPGPRFQKPCSRYSFCEPLSIKVLSRQLHTVQVVQTATKPVS